MVLKTASASDDDEGSEVSFETGQASESPAAGPARPAARDRRGGLDASSRVRGS